MKFKDFLLEKKEVHAVMAFGRMNPITTGHEKVVKTVKKIAKQVGGLHLIVISHSQDPKKNPLTAAQKVKYAKAAFPDTNFKAASKDAPTFFEHAEKLYKQGVTHLHMVAGSDRAGEYNRLFQKYNGTHKGARFNFDYIGIDSSGDRDPDSEGVEGISASKMREAASKGDFNTFKKGAPSSMSVDLKKQMYNDVRKGMNLKEEVELIENDLSRFSKYVMKVTKTEPKIVRKTNPAGRTSDHVEWEVHGTLSTHKRTFKSKKEAQEYYNTVKEDINIHFETMLIEGVHDKGIFKAVFLAGGPGSGKDYVLSNTLDGHGLTEINSDKALEFLMDKKGLDKRMPASETEARDKVRAKAKNVTELRQRLALQGRNGLIINGTGDDVEKVTKIKSKLEELGYDTSMILVNTNDEVSAQRNIERGQRGGRTVPETIRKEKWDNVQNARTEYARLFSNNYMEFDNSEDLRQAAPEVVRDKKMEMTQLFKNVQQFVTQPPQSPAAQEWVANELEQKDTLKPSKDGAEKIPPHGSGAAEEARKMGLQYYGFGRYGKNGKTTHRSVHDKLVQVTDKKPEQPKLPTPGSSVRKEEIDLEFESFISEDLRKWFDPKHPEGGWKRINSKGEAVGPCAREPGEPKPKCMSNEKRAKLSKKERASAVAAKRKHDPVADRGGKGGKPVNVSNFGKGKLSESVTVSITGDTVDEVKDFFNTMGSNLSTTSEEYALSDSKKELITLGKFTQPFGEKMENTTITNDMVENMLEQKEPNLLKDKSGKVRVFMLRSVAAKEAHTSQGTVLKYKNGYVVKLKEEIEDVEVFKGTIRNWIEESRKTRIGGSEQSTQRGLLTESGTISSGSSEGRRTESGRNQDGSTKEERTIQEACENNSTTKKITLTEIKQRQKARSEKQIDEIDRGIEPGISMAGAGESIGRDMGEKIKKRSHKVTVVELTGDETTASIGDQKEDELKKKGISLTTFKKRNYV
jgi:cytidyltransferase-like protein